MYVKNIRELKKNLRAKSRQFRERLDPGKKAEMDAAIRSRLFSLREYARAELLYTYVSKPIEVDTVRLIESVLAGKKRVAVPRCVPETLGMDFYEIPSLSSLEKGLFGVLEPPVSLGEPVSDAERSICIVPGLSFDSQGFRLGYGKGYYDRFLAGYHGITVGLCYSGCVRWNLPHGYYDRPVDILITEKYVRRISDKKI